MIRNDIEMQDCRVTFTLKRLALLAPITALLLAGCASEKAPDKEWTRDMHQAQQALDRDDRAQAEQLYLAAVKRAEQTGDDEQLSASLGHLAQVRYAQGKYTDAEQICSRRINLDQHRLGTNNLALADEFAQFAELEETLKKYDRAEELYRQAQQVIIANRGSSSPLAGVYLAKRAHLYLLQGKKSEAELFYSRSVTFLDDAQYTLSFEDDVAAKRRRLIEELARIRSEYADICEKDGRLEKAEALLTEAIGNLESLHGKGCPQATTMFESLTRVQEKLAAKAKQAGQN